MSHISQTPRTYRLRLMSHIDITYDGSNFLFRAGASKVFSMWSRLPKGDNPRLILHVQIIRTVITIPGVQRSMGSASDHLCGFWKISAPWDFLLG